MRWFDNQDQSPLTPYRDHSTKQSSFTGTRKYRMGNIYYVDTKLPRVSAGGSLEYYLL